LSLLCCLGADGGFLCHKPVILRDMIKGTLCLQSYAPDVSRNSVGLLLNWSFELFEISSSDSKTLSLSDINNPITNFRVLTYGGTDRYWPQNMRSVNRLRPSGYYTYHQVQYTKMFAHSVFMCFVWISEQSAIISLYSIN
jgi:hypothetical protein